MVTAQEIFESNATADELGEDLLNRQQEAYNKTLNPAEEVENESELQNEEEVSKENEENGNTESTISEESGDPGQLDNEEAGNDSHNNLPDGDIDNPHGDISTDNNETLSVFDKLNQLNNPDNLDVPDGMIPYRKNGKTEFATVEDYSSKFHMGADYTQKMQELATGRREVQKIQDMKISDKELALLDVIRSGDTSNIIKAIGKEYNINSETLLNSTVDLEDSHINNFQMPEAQAAQQNITQYSDEVKAMYNVFPQESIRPINDAISMLPESMVNLVGQNAQVLEAFAIDVNDGKAGALIGYANGELSKMDTFSKNLFLTDPSNFIKLYSEGAKKLFPAKSPERSEPIQQQSTNSNTERTISAAEREAKNRLNSNTHNIQQPSNNLNSTDNTRSNVEKILTEDGFVDKFTTEQYGQ